MENEEVNKTNSQSIRRIRRTIIGSCIMIVSLSLGVVCGVKISSAIKSNLTTNPFSQVTNILKNNWYSDIYYGEEVDEDLLIHQFIGALSTSEPVCLDPYTYLIQNEESGEIVQSGKLGITISSYYHYPVVIDVLENGAAYNQLQIGDIIIGSGKNTFKEYQMIDEKINYNNILQLALGNVGEEIYLSVARFNENQTLSFIDVKITLKDKILSEYAYVEKEKIEDTLMVKLTSFVANKNNDNTYVQLKNILKEDQSKNLILDMRDNGGGDLTSVVNICDLFLPKNKVVTSLQYKDGSKTIYKTADDELFSYDQIIFLTNENTASASEILISTLLYYYPEKVTLVGNQTYGKGIAQRKESVLNNHYTLQYTCAKWLRPDDSWIGMHGSVYEKDYPLGFTPLTENIVLKSDVLKLMEKNNANLFYKESEGYEGFYKDHVYSTNRYFFEIYNLMFDEQVRVDYYFDEECENAIHSYQERKNLAKTQMNETTFLYFIKDFYDLRQEFSARHLTICKNIIEGSLK